MLCGLDGNACLLTGICDVAHGRALHIAFPAQVVELDSPVHRAAIIPNDQVVDPPAVRVNELTLRGVRDELVDEDTAVLFGHAKNSARM